MAYSGQGVRNIHEFPKLIQANNQRLAAAGIKLQRYFTMGQYDMVAFVEAPGDEVQITSALSIGSQGNLRTTTMKAFTESEFLHMVERLPDD